MAHARDGGVRGVLPATRPLHRILLDFCTGTVFWPNFRGQFWRPSGAQNGSCSISSESSRRLLSNDISFAWIGVWTRELWLPKVRVLELFFRVFPAKIPAKRGKPLANQELHAVAGVVIFLTHPGLRINSLWVEKTLCASAVVREEKRVRFSARFAYFLSVFVRMVDLAPEVGFRRSWYRWKSCATLSFKVPDSRETEHGFARHGPTNRGHWSVFGLLEGIFPIRIPARPGKILAIREFHVVSEHVLFLTHPGLRINLLWVRKTLCASATSSGGKLWNFQHSLISSVSFRTHGRRGS